MGRLIETVEFQFSSMMNINQLHEKISFKNPPYILSRINEKCTQIKIKVVFRPWTKISPQTFNHELKFEGDKSQSSYILTISKDMFMRQMMRPYQDVLKNLEFAKQLKEKYDEARIDNAEEWNSYACDLEEKFS